jgi:hypothetical protein
MVNEQDQRQKTRELTEAELGTVSGGLNDASNYGF